MNMGNNSPIPATCSPSLRDIDMPSSRATLMLRGYTKIIVICVLMNQLMTSVFTFFVHQIDPLTPDYFITGFGIATCGLMGIWLQKDMQTAFLQAKKEGYIRLPDEKSPRVSISTSCRRRWLVILYIELHPAVVGA